MHTQAQWTGLFYTYLHNHNTLYSLLRARFTWWQEQIPVSCRTSRHLFFLSGEQKQGQQTSRMANICVMTATAKRVIVQWCFTPNQLLTGSMWSARGVEGLPRIKTSCLGAASPQNVPSHRLLLTDTLGWTPAPAEPTLQLIVTLSESDPLCSWQHML